MSNYYYSPTIGSTSSTTIGWTSWSPPEPDAQPMVEGVGPLLCSTSRTLVRRVPWVWDVNGYYRDLGVPTDATKRDIRLRYHEVDGQSSERLTYVTKQLCSTQTRREYDETPLGRLFIDKYVVDMLNRAAYERARRRMFADRAPMDADNFERYQRDEYERMGVATDDEAAGEDPDAPGDGDDLDAAKDSGQDDARPAKNEFDFAYLRWRLGRSGTDEDRARLTAWRALVVAAMAQMGYTTRIAVGLSGRRVPYRFAVAHMARGDFYVFFISADETPTEGLARLAADQWAQAAAPPTLNTGSR